MDGDTIGQRLDSKDFGAKDTMMTRFKPQIVITKITDRKKVDSLMRKKK